jgi:carbamoyl-phosphate synthase large subunit
LPEKVILLGSGALKIGQAGEFDYSGSQAIKALNEEGIKTILVNPNIATIQTSKDMAWRTYFLPVEASFVAQVIEKEKPDGILLSFGGQTALDCGVELHKRGILKKHGVKVLGTPIKGILDTEDRWRFVKSLNEIGVKVPRSEAVTNPDAALKAAKDIGFPVMIRAAFALGGQGSGVARSEAALRELAAKAFSFSKQILVEEFLGGWKEVEYEVVRDTFDNCIVVCNMENMDPLGIHTGESIVVAPSQTLNNREYHKLRDISIQTVRHLGVVGECNIQFALDPLSEDYRVIEVNARLSRSSALASKATGYPLAFVACKLALGQSLVKLRNSVTRATTACFEPALDYVVVKIPRWDLKKFKGAVRRIGTEMKSVGEIMAIGRKFEEALQKAIRMLGIGMSGLAGNGFKVENLKKELRVPTDQRLFYLAEAIRRGYSTGRLYKLTGVDPWFLEKIHSITNTAAKMKGKSLNQIDDELMLEAKQKGFSDEQIGSLTGAGEVEVRALRQSRNIRPVVKQIDTMAGEFPAKTNYLYLTYNGIEDDIDFGVENNVIVLGSGAYRIGSSVEFDWCCVSAVQSLRKMKYKATMINYNPETVSTDYDICDRLYFDELSLETVLEIYRKEKPLGLLVSMGGQIPNNLALLLHRLGIKILGTSAEDIDRAEDREKFSRLCDTLGLDQPEWRELTSTEEAATFARKIGYPVLVRPSYVLSGAAMNVAYNDKELKRFLTAATDVSREHPVVISKFIQNAREIEIDAVANKGRLLVWALSEHVENAGVHSGDATMVIPPQRTYLETTRRIKTAAKRLAEELNITGPFNIQFVARDNKIKIIECNLRASRSFPFVSKMFKVNFVDIATRAIMGVNVRRIDKSVFELDYVGVKAPQFSFPRIKGADPVLSVEMASTGEVGCFGEDIYEAFLKAILSVGYKYPQRGVLLAVGGQKARFDMLEPMLEFARNGINIFATKHTAKFLNAQGIPATMVYKAHNVHKKRNVLNLIRQGKVDLVINIPTEGNRLFQDQYLVRRASADYNIPLFTNIKTASLFLLAISRCKREGLLPKAWEEY